MSEIVAMITWFLYWMKVANEWDIYLDCVAVKLKMNVNWCGVLYAGGIVLVAVIVVKACKHV